MKSVDQKRPLKVFLCHAHADRDAVRALYTRLINDGVDAWLDKEKLLGGQNWRMEIRAAVEEADVVVVCHSKEFNKEGFRQREVKWALDAAMEKPEGTIFIIPARLEECEVIKSLSDWHWVDLFEEDGYEMLMRALRARGDKIGATLQTKKSWFPKNTSSNLKVQKAIEIPSNEKEKHRSADNFEDKKKDLERGLKKIEKDHKKQIQRIEWRYRWESFIGEVRYRLKLLYISRLSILIILVTLAVVIPLSIGLFKKIPEIIEPFDTTPTTVFASLPLTETPNAENLTATPISAPTSLPTEIMDAKGVSMALVPAGEFTMGSETYDDEKPIHQVYLDTFYIDIYEVTNAMYEKCVSDGVCDPPQQTSSYTRSSYYGDSQFDNYPVIYVDWNQANTYCKWRGTGLPTEAQWEKAARGTDERIYPWGEDISCDKANYFSGDACVGDTTKVGSYETGKSPYSIYDMAGNVWEWVNDWYEGSYYQSSPSSNPLGPSSGQDTVWRGGSGQPRVLRGGSWGNVEDDVRSAYRDLNIPGNVNYFVGFRCAKDTTQ